MSSLIDQLMKNADELIEETGGSIEARLLKGIIEETRMSIKAKTAAETIAFTPELRDSLRIAYKEAQEAKLDTFTWEGRQFVTSYAKYMLVYLDDKMGAPA